MRQGWAHEFRINHFYQSNFLKPYCSVISLYECLEADLVKSDRCGGLCEVASLPYDLLPLCKSDEQYECSKTVFMETITDSAHKCRKERSCTEITYDMRIAIYEDIYGTPERVHFEYTLETPMSSEGLRQQSPYKIVHTEYLLWTDVSFIANIGGTLGVTIGNDYFSARIYSSSIPGRF